MLALSTTQLPPWVAGDGTQADLVISTHCTLLRNLADCPFTRQCSLPEREAVEERVVSALESLGFMDRGTYVTLPGPDASAIRLLAERQVIPFDALRTHEHRGFYVADDESVAIVVNGLGDHISITMNASGVQFRELWKRLSHLDDQLARYLDFAFDKRLGYLTSSLSNVGTGLRAGALLHLPAVKMPAAGAPPSKNLIKDGEFHRLWGVRPTVEVALPRHAGEESHLPQKEAQGAHYTSAGLYMMLGESLQGPPAAEAVGDLYFMTNRATLGYAEEELLFHLRHAVENLLGAEREARQRLLNGQRIRIVDHVARALALAQNARLLDLFEGLSLLSALRLGTATGILDGYDLRLLNKTMLAAQAGHLKVEAEPPCDEWTLSIHRAELFRELFSENAQKRPDNHAMG